MRWLVIAFLLPISMASELFSVFHQNVTRKFRSLLFSRAFTFRKRATLYSDASLLGNESASRAEKRTANFCEVASQDALLLR